MAVITLINQLTSFKAILVRRASGSEKLKRQYSLSRAERQRDHSRPHAQAPAAKRARRLL